MKIINLLISILLVFISCHKNSLPREIGRVTIDEIKIDSASIRAIHAIDSYTVAYAASNGTIGFYEKDSQKLTTINIKYKDSLIPNFRSIATNGKTFFALSITNPALLYAITDGKYELKYSEKHPKVFYDAMSFFDDNIHGIAIGDPTENCPSIILTSDGGNSWNKIPCSQLPEFHKGEAFFAASNTNIKTIGSTVWIASGGKKARVLKSNNFGNTWQVFDTPIVQGNESQGIYSIDFIDENNGIIIGGDYTNPLKNKANKAITKNGGITWSLIADQQNPNYKSCVQYVPNTHGKEIFAVGKTGVSYSKNGGKSWKSVSKEAYFSIQFVDKNTAWLSGNNKLGTLYLK